MSDKMTSVHLPGLRQGAGLSDWGHLPSAQMIAQLRSMARMIKEESEQILAADDADFRVEQYVGKYARKGVVVLQEGRK